MFIFCRLMVARRSACLSRRHFCICCFCSCDVRKDLVCIDVRSDLVLGDVCSTLLPTVRLKIFGNFFAGRRDRRSCSGCLPQIIIELRGTNVVLVV